MTEPMQRLAPPGQVRTVLAAGSRAADIIELIMADHRRIRRLCGALDDAARSSRGPGPGWLLEHAWRRFAGVLESHIRAEEEICYLAMFGSGPQARAHQRRDAIADDDDIREAIGEASLQRVGSALWWGAVRAAVAASAAHLQHAEGGALADWQLRLTASQRRELGRQWSAFIAASALDAAPLASG